MAATVANPPSNNPLSAFEVDSFVDQLSFEPDLKKIGTPQWMKQHQLLEKLNIQAHLNTQNQCEEFVTEALITADKVSWLVKSLVAIDLWKSKVLPSLLAECTKLNTVHVYFVMYHEATIVNLLEIVLYSNAAVDSLKETSLDLIDYCMRKMTALVAWEHEEVEATPTDKDSLVKSVLEAEDKEHLYRSKKEIDFSVMIGSITIFRYLCDRVGHLSLAAVSRMLASADAIGLCAELVNRSPWLRRAKGQVQRYQQASWNTVSKEELSVFGIVEVQVWLALFSLLFDNECRRKYQYSVHRQENLLKLRDFITSTVMEQLPIMSDLKRYLEELSLMTFPETVTSSLILEEISEVSTALTENTDWKSVIEFHKRMFQNTEANSMRELAMGMASVYDLTDLDVLLGDPKCAQCGNVATQRCSRCKTEWYCGRPCQVKGWKAHKGICDLVHGGL